MYALEFTLFTSGEPYLEVFACSTLFLGETITPPKYLFTSSFILRRVSERLTLG